MKTRSTIILIVVISLLSAGFLYAGLSNLPQKQPNISNSISAVQNESKREIASRNTYVTASTGEVKPLVELASVGVGEENTSKRNWNSKTFNLADGKEQTEFHIKWINWLDANDQWQSINPNFTDKGAYFGMDQAPFIAEVPKVSTGTAKFISNNRWDIFDKKKITDAPMTMNIESQGVVAVNGQIENSDLGWGTVSYILYPNAYPFLNADLIYWVHQGRAPSLKKLIRFNSNPNTGVDVNLSFKLAFDSDQEIKIDNLVWSRTRAKKRTNKGVSIKKAGAIGRRAIGMKDFYIWDSATSTAKKKQAIDVDFDPQADDSIILTKIVPKTFLDTAVYPVFTDIESTFYPSPGTVTDGSVARSGQDETFSTLRTSAGTYADPDAGTINMLQLQSTVTTDQYNNLYRSIFLFDTSSIGSGQQVDTAVLSLYGAGGQAAQGVDIGVVSASPAGNTTLVGTDYNIANFGSTEFATRVDFTAFTNGAYNDFTLNAAGRSNVNMTGISKFGVRDSFDLDNGTPTWSSNAFIYYMNCRSSDYAGTTSDPKLVVNYSAAPSSDSASLDKGNNMFFIFD